MLLQIPISTAIDDAPLLERLLLLLAQRSDPTDLQTCTFGTFLPLAWEGPVVYLHNLTLMTNGHSALTAEMIQALWDISHSFFVCLPPNQHQRILQRAIRRGSGFVLHLDHSLLVALLYGDDTAQAEMDKLLISLQDVTTGLYNSRRVASWTASLTELDPFLTVLLIFRSQCHCATSTSQE